MLTPSDLIGLTLDEAQERLAHVGDRVRAVIETQPPRSATLAGPLRVVRARRDPEGAVDLVVSRERYVPPLTPQ